MKEKRCNFINFDIYFKKEKSLYNKQKTYVPVMEVVLRVLF